MSTFTNRYREQRHRVRRDRGSRAGRWFNRDEFRLASGPQQGVRADWPLSRFGEVKNFYVRENLGGIQTYVNPYDTQRPLELHHISVLLD